MPRYSNIDTCLAREQILFDALGNDQMSAPQLMAVTGLPYASTVLCMERLHGKKKVYVAAYDPAVKRGWRKPIYAQGNLPDAIEAPPVQVKVARVKHHWYSGLGL